MMKKELQFLIALFFLIQCSFAQRFPVKIVPRVQAPSPVNFYNYADDTSLNSPITLQLFLNDLTVSNRQIRLKTYFEGGNISFTSKDFVIGAENIFIEGGIPLTLKNTDLAPYYKLENLQGISNTVYGLSIPEGSYNFCFEVYDFISGAKLSAKECRRVFIFKNEPPILNVPLNGINIKPNDFENIVFQWTPRHINVSNVEYEFSLVEIWDDKVNPQTAFLSQTPIYEETTRATTLIYGPDKPLLLPEKRYAWRVKAKALQGLEEIGLFKNQGFSEVFWFSRTAPCMVPENISAEPKGLSKINIFWDQDPTLHSEYVIAYREADKEYAKWFTKRTNSAWATIWNLKPGTKYEYKVKGKCKYQFSDYSKVQYITTDIVTNDDANYNCGIVPDHIAISNRDPHPDLRRGDEVTAGDFLIVLTHISSQSNGRISGVGYVVVPYLNFAKFAVYYENVLINTDNQLAEGEIVTLYDPEFGENASMTVDINFENEEEEEPVSESEGVNQDTNTSDTPVENTGGETPENNTPTETTEGTETPPPGAGENPPPTGEEIPPTDTTKTKSEDPPPPSDEGETGESETEEKEAVIDYNGKIYKHEDIIEVPYNIDKTNFAFTLKDYPENAKINWQVLKGGTDNTSAFATNETIHDNFGIDMKEMHILDVVANYNDKKIKVTIKRVVQKFDFIELTVEEKANKQRKAKSNEILYLVKNSLSMGSKDVKYKVKINPKLNTNIVPPSNIKWNFDGKDDKLGVTERIEYLKKRNTVHTTKVSAGYPNQIKKKVNVKWINRGFNKNTTKFDYGIDLMPYIEKLAKKFDIPVRNDQSNWEQDRGFSILADTQFLTTVENKEDVKSRLVFNEKRQTFKTILGVKGKFEKPIFGLPKFDETFMGHRFLLEAGIYFFIEGNAFGEIGATIFTEDWVEEKKIRNKKYKKFGEPARIVGNVSLGLDPKIKLEASKYITASITGKSFAYGDLFVYDLVKQSVTSPIIDDGFQLKCTPSGSITIFGWSKITQWDEYIYNVKW